MTCSESVHRSWRKRTAAVLKAKAVNPLFRVGEQILVYHENVPTAPELRRWWGHVPAACITDSIEPHRWIMNPFAKAGSLEDWVYKTRFPKLTCSALCKVLEAAKPAKQEPGQHPSGGSASRTRVWHAARPRWIWPQPSKFRTLFNMLKTVRAVTLSKGDTVHLPCHSFRIYDKIASEWCPLMQLPCSPHRWTKT